LSYERSTRIKTEKACNGLHPVVAAADNVDDDDGEYCRIQAVGQYQQKV
jgi:hypothetical protein